MCSGSCAMSREQSASLQVLPGPCTDSSARPSNEWTIQSATPRSHCTSGTQLPARMTLSSTMKATPRCSQRISSEMEG